MLVITEQEIHHLSLILTHRSMALFGTDYNRISDRPTVTFQKIPSTPRGEARKGHIFMASASLLFNKF